MNILISIIAALSFLGSIVTFLNAKSAVHEILAAILMVCFVVAAVGMAAVQHLAKIELLLAPRAASTPNPQFKSAPTRLVSSDPDIAAHLAAKQARGED